MRIERVDYLRGWAILGVFLYHASFALFGYYQTRIGYDRFLVLPDSSYHNFMPYAYGGAGVFLFFIISGFLIHLGYSCTKSFESAKYINKRFWRIYPPYVLALIFFLLAEKEKFISGKVLSHLLLVHNYLPDEGYFSINGSFWSLAVEVQIYVLYPFFLYMRRKTGPITYVNTFLLCLLIIVIRTYFNWTGAAHILSLAYFVPVWLSGAFLAEKFREGKRLFKVNGWGVLVIGIIAYGSKLFSVFNYLSIFICSFACLVFTDWYLHRTVKPSGVSRLFYVCMSTLGICSYSFYLIHQPFLYDLVKFFSGGFRSIIFSVAAVFVVFLLFFGLSYVLYQTIELTSLRTGSRFLKRTGDEAFLAK